jgi:hypothetical protein
MSKPSPDKLIVSNCAQLAKKYKAPGLGAIEKAVKALIKADAARGLVTTFVDLSDAPTMASYSAPAVPAASAGNAKLNKQVIDKVFGSGDPRPAYLMLLGSTDVIPHVPLDNPVAGDGDSDVPSDLPYACDKAYSSDVQDFIAPTRAVARLPNVTGDTDAIYLVSLLQTAATYADRPLSGYDAFLGISAQVWKKSSELSLDAVFRTHAGMKIAPPDGSKWSAAEAKRLSHFVNCHGAPGDPNFYGQKGASFPVAHSAAWMANKVVEGTVLAAECCYGAELYDPSLPTAGGQMGMCNTYLGRRCYAYFGSSTTAYGPDASNDQADLICQYFLQEVLDGASAGRACLQARLQYVKKKAGVMAPTDLKTIAQFNLMADPALTPVVARVESTVIPSRHAKNVGAAVSALARHARNRRRKDLEARAATATAYRLLEPTAPGARAKSTAFGKLRELAAAHGIKAPDVVLSYLVGAVPAPTGRKGLAVGAAVAELAPKAVHVILERRDPPKDVPHMRLIRGVQAVEFDEGMVAQPFESR